MPITRLLLALLALVVLEPARAQDPVYIALGDSVAFGRTAVLVPSYGDQGYVKPFADGLAGQYGGERPDVVNLAISGETSSSFFTGSPPPGWTGREPLYNLNYTDAGRPQFAAFLDTVASERAAGNRVDWVSFALGANDLFHLIGSPEFQDPGADRAILAAQLLGQVRGNYITFLEAFRQELPDTELLLPNYSNPIGFLGPDNPLNQFAVGVYQAHSAIVSDLAGQYGGRYVDIYTPFLGHETEYTNIAFGDPHPTTAGYAVIAEQMRAAAAIPEPGSLVLLAAGGLLAAVRRRRA